MPCQDCDNEDLSLCTCTDGKNAFTLSTSNTTIADPMTIAVSNVDPYTGAWAKVGQPIWISGYGTYICTASTATSISVSFPTAPFTGGAAYSLGTVDFDNSGSIPSGTKISPGGMKGDTGASAVPAIIEEVGHGSYVNGDIGYVDLITPESVGPLATTGDSLRITAKFWYNDFNGSGVAQSGTATVKILLAGTSITLEPNIGLEPIAFNKAFSYWDAELIVTSRSSGAAVDVRIDLSYATQGLISGSGYSLESLWANKGSISYESLNLAIDVTSATNLSIQGTVSDADTEIKMGYYLIENLQQI